MEKKEITAAWRESRVCVCLICLVWVRDVRVTYMDVGNPLNGNGSMYYHPFYCFLQRKD